MKTIKLNHSNQKTILVVEDDPDFRESVGTILEYEGFHVILASTAEQGLQLFREYNPHLILSDFNLPAMCGLDLLEAIQKLKHPDPIRFILMTAQNFTPESLWKNHPMGCPVINKPFSISELMNQINLQLDLQPVSISPPSVTNVVSADRQ